MLGVAAGAIGYLAALQFHFSTIAASPTFWVMAGSGLRASVDGKALVVKNRLYFIAPLVCVLAIWPFASITPAKGIMADMKLRKALVEASRGNATPSYLLFIEAEQLQPFEEHYPLSTGQILLQLAEKARSARLIDEASKAFRRALALNPLDEYATVGLGDAEFAKWRLLHASKHLRRARKYYVEVLKTDPNFWQVRRKSSKVSALLGQTLIE